MVLFGSDLDLMKAKFAKLLLGEDMSGGGKGVSSALALSNAITNLAGFFFFFVLLVLQFGWIRTFDLLTENICFNQLELQSDLY